MCRKSKRDKGEEGDRRIFAYTEQVVSVICLKEKGREREREIERKFTISRKTK